MYDQMRLVLYIRRSTSIGVDYIYVLPINRRLLIVSYSPSIQGESCHPFSALRKCVLCGVVYPDVLGHQIKIKKSVSHLSELCDDVKPTTTPTTEPAPV